MFSLYIWFRYRLTPFYLFFFFLLMSPVLFLAPCPVKSSAHKDVHCYLCYHKLPCCLNLRLAPCSFLYYTFMTWPWLLRCCHLQLRLHLTRLGCLASARSQRQTKDQSVFRCGFWTASNTVGTKAVIRLHESPSLSPTKRSRCWLQIRLSHPVHYITVTLVIRGYSYFWLLCLVALSFKCFYS